MSRKSQAKRKQRRQARQQKQRAKEVVRQEEQKKKAKYRHNEDIYVKFHIGVGGIPQVPIFDKTGRQLNTPEATAEYWRLKGILHRILIKIIPDEMQEYINEDADEWIKVAFNTEIPQKVYLIFKYILCYSSKLGLEKIREMYGYPKLVQIFKEKGKSELLKNVTKFQNHDNQKHSLFYLEFKIYDFFRLNWDKIFSNEDENFKDGNEPFFETNITIGTRKEIEKKLKI